VSDTRCPPEDGPSGGHWRFDHELSYQRHARRVEHWLVVHGAGRVTLEGEEFDVLAGSAVDVPVGAAHRIANSGTTGPLIFIEVQRGDYFGEDDIVRLADDYGRVGGTS